VLLSAYLPNVALFRPEEFSIRDMGFLSLLISAIWLLFLLVEVCPKRFMAVKAPNYQVFSMQALALYLAHPLSSWLPFDVFYATSPGCLASLVICG
jgi:hypothetical protein